MAIAGSSIKLASRTSSKSFCAYDFLGLCILNRRVCSVGEMHHHSPQSNWSHLSREVWGNVFTMIKPDAVNWHVEYCWDWQRFDQKVQHFHALPCVCKLFQSIFDDQPELYSALSLGEHLDCKHLSGLYHGAQGHGHSVEHLLALSGSPYLEAALTALQSNKSQHEPAHLTTLCIAHTSFSDYELRPVSDAAVVLLTPFTSLVSFTLDAGSNAHGPDFRLYALQGLPLLSSLV